MVQTAGNSVTQEDLDLATGRYHVGGAAFYARPKLIRNRPAHPALTGARPTWLGPNPTRGKMIRYAYSENTADGGVVFDRGSRVAEFNFLFNPTTISTGVTVDENAAYESYAADKDVPLIGQTTLSFSLLVDRTFEVLERPGSKWHLPNGVLSDLYVLETMIGVRNGQNEVIGGVAADKLRVVFGGPNSFEFIGHVVSINKEITHFSPAMVPTRMAVSMNFIRTHHSADLAASGTFLAPRGSTDYTKAHPNPALYNTLK